MNVIPLVFIAGVFAGITLAAIGNHFGIMTKF